MCIYNSNEYLERIINNIYGQTFNDFNLIISDSAPNANVVEFIMSLKKEKNNIFYFQSLTPGYINNLNNALSNSVSDYICFVDPDDYISENKLEEQVKYLDSHEDVDIVSCMTFLSSNMALANTCADLNHETISNFIDSNSFVINENKVLEGISAFEEIRNEFSSIDDQLYNAVISLVFSSSF